MARSSLFTIGLLLSCWIRQWGVSALQVTPNSPCSSSCVDSTSLDLSDPNSSNTKGSDITCQDAQFGSSPAGIKWQNCMSCLQNSTFSQGSENDQMWFLYNMRYSLSYCVFNFLNSTNVGGSPCVTSFACGTLNNALKDGVLTPQTATQYGYCSADGGVMTHDNIVHCGSCVKATGETQYLANYLVGLDAGCQQKPEPGHILGLNGSIFSPTVIGIVDPSTVVPANNPDNKSTGLPTTTIAGIVVAVIALILVIAAIIFIRYKKRSNRRKRASYESKSNTPWGITSNQMPTSPLSFQCQTHMGPPTPKFFPDADDDQETTTYSPSSSPQLGRKNSLWKPHNAISSFQNISAVTEREKDGIQMTSPLQYHPTNELHSLNTTTLPSYPSQTHASPMSAGITRFSPQDYNTPTSATSVRSTAPLLPYNPAEYSAAGAARGPSGLSPVSGTGSSPLLKGGAWSRRDVAPTPPAKSEADEPVMRFKGVGRRKEERGSPVESRTLGTSFPPPPPPRR